jgi:hypothetical protein
VRAIFNTSVWLQAGQYLALAAQIPAKQKSGCRPLLGARFAGGLKAVKFHLLVCSCVSEGLALDLAVVAVIGSWQLAVGSYALPGLLGTTNNKQQTTKSGFLAAFFFGADLGPWRRGRQRHTRGSRLSALSELEEAKRRLLRTPACRLLARLYGGYIPGLRAPGCSLVPAWSWSRLVLLASLACGVWRAALGVLRVVVPLVLWLVAFWWLPQLLPRPSASPRGGKGKGQSTRGQPGPVPVPVLLCFISRT